MSIESGEGTSTSSGVIAVRSANSGALVRADGWCSAPARLNAGNSGALYLGSGVATGGRGGMVSISVGSGTSGSGWRGERALGPQHGAQRRCAEPGERRGHGDEQRCDLDSDCERRRDWCERAAGV